MTHNNEYTVKLTGAQEVEDLLRQAIDRLAELEAEVRKLRDDRECWMSWCRDAREERDEQRAAYLRLCRDLTMYMRGYHAVPGGRMEGDAGFRSRLEAAMELGASEEARTCNED